MNAKKSKALRKMMRNLEAQQGSGELPNQQLLENVAKARTVTVTTDELLKMGLQPDSPGVTTPKPQLVTVNGEPKEIPSSTHQLKIGVGPIKNSPNSKRGLYLHFKEKMVELEKDKTRRQ